MSLRLAQTHVDATGATNRVGRRTTALSERSELLASSTRSLARPAGWPELNHKRFGGRVGGELSRHVDGDMILAPVPPAKVQGAGLFLLSSEGGASKPTCNLSDAVWTLPLSSASDVSPGAGPTASTHANMAAVAGPRPTSSASPGDLGSTLKAGSSSLDPDTAVNSSNRASSSNGKAPETNGVSSNGTSSPEAGAGGGEGGAEMSRPGPEVNPIFQVKEQIENLGEEEAHLEQTKDGGMVVKPGKQPSSRGWIPWRSKSDRDIVDGGLNLSRNPADQDGPDRPATTTQANGKGVGLNGEDPDPTFSTTSSGVDSVRMKIFTKLLPEGVEQHPAIPQRADRLDVSDLLNVRPQSPGHSTQTSISGELASLTSSPPTANGDLPSSKGDAQGSASPVASASDAAANGQDPHGLDLPPSEAKDGSRPRAGSTPGQAVVGQPEGLGVANSRLTPATEDSPRLLATGALLPQFDPHHSSSSHSHEAGPSDRSTPSPNPGRRSAAMQRANTAAGGLEVASSSRNLEASPSRQFGPSSPSMGQRTKSHDPTHFRRAMGKDEPPARQRSGDDFEDEMARKADVMRRERRDRREAEKDDGGHSKDKGKRRVSGTGSEGEKEKVLVGNLIGEGHENYVMMYNMLTGIRIGVSPLISSADGARLIFGSAGLALSSEAEATSYRRRLHRATQVLVRHRRQRADALSQVRLQVQGLRPLGLSRAPRILSPRSGRLPPFPHRQVHPF